jgi:hemerythrin-like metal-binding protein
MMEWTPNLSVGAEADSDHRHLMDLVNELEQVSRKGRDRAAVVVVLERLVSYTKMHFLREETEMSRRGYPALDPHLEEHTELTGRLLALQAEFQAARAWAVRPQAMDSLRDWMLKHIQGPDRAVAEYFRAQRERSSPHRPPDP